MVAHLTSKGLLVYRTNRQINFDGTIERVGEEWPVISWQRESVQYWLQVVHETHQALIASHRGLVLTQRPVVRMEFEQTSTQSSAALLDSIESSLELPLILFSLLSRQTIEWFDLSVHVG